MKREDEGAAGHRLARLQGLVFEELRALLRDDVTDPALAEVRLTAVVLSADYRHARVHFAWIASQEPVGSGPFDTAKERAIDRSLVRATPFLRARLAEVIEVKRVPDLRFVFDGAVAEPGNPPCTA